MLNAPDTPELNLDESIHVSVRGKLKAACSSVSSFCETNHTKNLMQLSACKIDGDDSSSENTFSESLRNSGLASDVHLHKDNRTETMTVHYLCSR